MSSTRQQQLMQDRQKTAAISAYLKDHRADLEKELDPATRGAQKRRKELEKMARLRFKEEPDSEQRRYLEKCRRRPGDVSQGPLISAGDAASDDNMSGRMDVVDKGASSSAGVKRKSSALTENTPGVVALTVKETGASGRPEVTEVASEDTQRIAGAVDAAKETLELGGAEVPHKDVGRLGHAVVAAQEPVASGELTASNEDAGGLGHVVAAAKEPEAPAVAAQGLSNDAWGSPLRDGLAQALPALRKAYGSTAGVEVWAQGLRILDAIEEKISSWPTPINIKVAVIAGLAAKLTQPARKERHIVQLWAALAGKGSESAIREMEPAVVQALADTSISLVADYVADRVR